MKKQQEMIYSAMTTDELNAQKWRRGSKRNSGTWSMRQTGNWMSLSTTRDDTATPTTWERSERSSRVTIELSLLLSGISVAFAIFFGISNKKRNDKKDAEQETEERATANTLMMTKLENIADDVKDIKRDYKETRAEVQDLHDRVLIVEQSLKSYHKRLDGMNLNIKTDQ